MSYIDGFVMVVSKKKLPAYFRMSRAAGKVWREHGALEYRECVGDDLAAPGTMPFPKRVQLKPGEAVVFSWIVYKSKAQRNQVNAKVMKDPRLMKMAATMQKSPLFDMKRMSCGGFKVIVDL